MQLLLSARINLQYLFQYNHARFELSGGATSRQPGHFQVTKVVRQVMHFFPQTSFLVVALKTQAANAADCFTVKMKQIKRADTYRDIC